MNNKEFFQISESFYNKEFSTPKEKIFELYDIGNWNIKVCKQYKVIDLSVFGKYLKKIVTCFPYIDVNRLALRSHLEVWERGVSAFTFQEWLDRTENHNRGGLEQDLGYIYFDYNVKKHNKSIPFNKGGSIWFSFDPDCQIIGFNLCFNVDLFTKNPSRQPDVYLSEEELTHNNSLLSNSLKNIDNSDTFRITSFESPFHPDKIFKYGFKY